MVKIATWNVNSVKTRLVHLLEYLNDAKPDVLLLQEIKCMTEAFPYMEVEDLGYNVVAHGQKSYNGVAIISKYPIEDVIKALPGDESDEQARYIEAVISLPDRAIRVASIYVPNGQMPDSEKFIYKLKFFDRLYDHVDSLLSYDEVFVLGGDYNVAPDRVDVFDPDKLDGTTCFHPKEREKFRRLINLGVYDGYRLVNPDKQCFSWWDYRAGSWQNDYGMRIDHLLISPKAADLLKNCDTDKEPRKKEKPSDHAPVWCLLDC